MIIQRLKDGRLRDANTGRIIKDSKPLNYSSWTFVVSDLNKKPRIFAEADFFKEGSMFYFSISLKNKEDIESKKFRREEEMERAFFEERKNLYREYR